MAHGKAGRPGKDELAARCHGKNNHGGVCGNPATIGPYCVHHAGPKDLKAQATTGARLAALTIAALDAIEQILDHGAEDAKIRAAKIVLDRSAPATGPHAVVIVGGPAAHDGSALTSRQILDERMAELRRKTAELAEPESADSASDLEIIDAEIVDETSEPVTSHQVWEGEEFGTTREYERDESNAPQKRKSNGPTIVVERGYGVPGVTSRPADLTRMAADRFG